MPLVFADPPISTSLAHALTFGFAFAYVGSLYVSKNARLSFNSKTGPGYNGRPREKLSEERWRDDPEVIQARLVAVTIATVICCASIFALLWHFIGDDDDSFWTALDTTSARLGFKLYVDLDSLYPHMITPILFMGPIYARFLAQALPFQKNWSYKEDVAARFVSWQGVRNYFLAPITEEVVFRACVLAVYHLSGASLKKMIFLGPLSFGLAHVHHAWDTFNRYGRTASAAKRAIIMSVFQLAYTTLFGFHCSYLFLRTSSIYPAISAHIFCNIMGLPELTWELRKFPSRRNAILCTYVLGIGGFVYLYARWTLTLGSLYWHNVPSGRGNGSF